MAEAVRQPAERRGDGEANAGEGERSRWRRELHDLLHGAAGAFLFGAPLLYTMEVWWKGNFTSPPRMLLTLALAYGALVLLAATTGFRARRATTPARVLADSAEALALGLLLAASSLAFLRRIAPGDGLSAVLGRIVLEAVPFSIGIGIANGLLRPRGDDEGGQGGDKGAKAEMEPAWRAMLVDAGATLLGATIIAFSIAPTDEVPMIAAALSGPWLLGVILASLAISYLIVFEANFGAQAERRRQRGIIQRPLSQTVTAYLLSLLMAGIMLWLFQSIRPGDPPRQWVGYVIVLGLPATIGGAAGRLAV